METILPTVSPCGFLKSEHRRCRICISLASTEYMLIDVKVPHYSCLHPKPDTDQNRQYVHQVGTTPQFSTSFLHVHLRKPSAFRSAHPNVFADRGPLPVLCPRVGLCFEHRFP